MGFEKTNTSSLYYWKTRLGQEDNRYTVQLFISDEYVDIRIAPQLDNVKGFPEKSAYKTFEECFLFGVDGFIIIGV